MPRSKVKVYEVLPVLVQLVPELSRVRAENRELRRRVKQLEASRAEWRRKATIYSTRRCHRQHLRERT